MNDFKDNSWNDKPRKRPRRYSGPALNEEIQQLPGGAPRMAALREAIAQADREEDHRWRLFFRYDYACEAIFRDDPPSVCRWRQNSRLFLKSTPTPWAPAARRCT